MSLARPTEVSARILANDAAANDSVVPEMAFEFPDIYNFAPFFTCVPRRCDAAKLPAPACGWRPGTHAHLPLPACRLQPVDSTRTKQLEQWRQLIVAWHQHSKQTTLTVKEWPHWENKAIGRACPRGCRACRKLVARWIAEPVSLCSVLVPACAAGKLSDEAVAAVLEHVIAAGACPPARQPARLRSVCRAFFLLRVCVCNCCLGTRLPARRLPHASSHCRQRRVGGHIPRPVQDLLQDARRVGGDHPRLHRLARHGERGQPLYRLPAALGRHVRRCA